MREWLRRLPRLEAGILLLALIILTVVGVERKWAAERTEVEPDSYSTHDTKTGGYQAWYEMLQREGTPVSRFELRPAFLDRSIDTLIWADPLPFDTRQQFPTKNDVNALEAWIRAGGRLVYIGHDDAAASQGLIGLPHSHVPATKGEPFVAPELAAAGVRHVPAITQLRWVPNAKRTVLLADASGPLVVRYPFGKGQVIAAIDEPSFTNANVGVPDRARLAYALAQPRAGGTVAFNEEVHGFLTPEHWWAVVPRPFAIAIWCALGVLLFAFAGAALRLGPPVIPRSRDPNSAAFLDALAALFERGRAVRKSLLDAASSATRAVARSLGLPDDTPPEQLAAAIEQPEQRRMFVALGQISSNAFPNEKNHVRGVALAQRVRKEFTTHGRPRY